MLSQGEQRHFPYLGIIPTLRCDPDHLDVAVWRRVIGAAQLETLRDLHEHIRAIYILGVEPLHFMLITFICGAPTSLYLAIALIL